MTEHTLRWRCPAKAHRDQHFETQDAFRAHLLEGHKKAYSDAELAMLISRSRKATGPLFTSCPLCGDTTEEVNGKLEQHIAGHLRSLALKSLPPVRARPSRLHWASFRDISVRATQRRSMLTRAATYRNMTTRTTRTKMGPVIRVRLTHFPTAARSKLPMTWESHSFSMIRTKSTNHRRLGPL